MVKQACSGEVFLGVQEVEIFRSFLLLYAFQNLLLLLKFLSVMIESDPSLIKELQCTQQARKRSLNFFRRNPDKPKQTEKKWLSRDTCTSSFAFGRSSALNCDCITLVICRPLISGTVGESTEVPLEGSVYYILVSSLTYKFFYCFCLFFSSS